MLTQRDLNIFLNSVWINILQIINQYIDYEADICHYKRDNILNINLEERITSLTVFW